MMPKHFFIGGAQRSGTTYAYHVCADHPYIEMAHPVKPEPKFFMNDELVAKGLDYYRQTYFGEKPGALLYGEKSTSYIEIERAAQHVSTYLPDAKFVFVLRNPVERAVSNYWFSVKHGVETLPIEAALHQESERMHAYDASKISVSPFAYLKRGHYMEYLDVYLRYFPREQIHVLIYEQMVAGLEPIQDLYRFLGVDADFDPPSRHQRINANDVRPADPIAPELQVYMEQHFAASNQALAHWLGRDIPEWGVFREV